MAQSGEKMFKAHLDFLDRAIIEVEKNPNKNLEIFECLGISQEKSQQGEMAKVICDEIMFDGSSDFDKFDDIPIENILGAKKEKIEQGELVEVPSNEITSHGSSSFDKFVDIMELVSDESNDFEKFDVIPVKNPKGRPKSKKSQNVFNKLATKANVVDKTLLTEYDLCKILLSNLNTVPHRQIYLTNTIMFCFLRVLSENLGQKNYIFDSTLQFDIENFDCNLIV